MTRTSLLEDRLRQLAGELVKYRDQLAQLDDELSRATDLADDARLRASLAETPAQDAAHQEASHLELALSDAREALCQAINGLERAREALLRRQAGDPT